MKIKIEEYYCYDIFDVRIFGIVVDFYRLCKYIFCWFGLVLFKFYNKNYVLYSSLVV